MVRCAEDATAQMRHSDANKGNRAAESCHRPRQERGCDDDPETGTTDVQAHAASVSFSQEHRIERLTQEKGAHQTDNNHRGKNGHLRPCYPTKTAERPINIHLDTFGNTE